MTSASEQSQSTLQTKIQLSGAVDVNFKSDYLPLDKMATPQMIAAIQGNSTPGRSQCRAQRARTRPPARRRRHAGRRPAPSRRRRRPEARAMAAVPPRALDQRRGARRDRAPEVRQLLLSDPHFPRALAAEQRGARRATWSRCSPTSTDPDGVRAEIAEREAKGDLPATG